MAGWLLSGHMIITASWSMALCYSLPSSMSEPSDLLPTNKLWQRSGDASSRIRLQRVNLQRVVTSTLLVDSLHRLLGLNMVIEASCHDGQANVTRIGGCLQPTAVRKWDPKFNCLWGTKSWNLSHELGSRFFPRLSHSPEHTLTAAH